MAKTAIGGNDPLAFNPTQMRAAFDSGRALGAQGNPWQGAPTNSGDVPARVYKELKLLPPPPADSAP